MSRSFSAKQYDSISLSTNSIRRKRLYPRLSPIHTADADATQLSSWVAPAVCIEFATSWRQSRRVWTICRQRSRVASCRRCERTNRQSWPSFQFSAPVTSWVASASRRRCVLNSQLAHDDCRRLRTKIWKLNMLRIYPVQLSCVGGVYTPVGCRDPVYNILQPIYDWRRKLETGSRLTTGAFTPPTRRNSTSLSANCSDSSRLVETVAN